MSQFTRVVSLTLASFFCASSAFADLRLLGSVGYDSVTTKGTDGEKDYTYTGTGFGALGQFDVARPVPGLGIFVGAGLKMNSVVYEKDGSKVTWDSTLATGEGGVNFGLIPMLDIQGAIGYDYGISGEIKSEGTLLGVTASTTTDIDTNTRLRLTGRGLFTLLPMVRVGGEFSLYPSGSVKSKREGATSADTSGWGVAFVAGVSL